MKIKINTPYIKLDSLLKLAGIVVTGGQAKELINKNQVTVNKDLCTMRGKKIKPGDIIKIKGKKESLEVILE